MLFHNDLHNLPEYNDKKNCTIMNLTLNMVNKLELCLQRINNSRVKPLFIPNSYKAFSLLHRKKCTTIICIKIANQNLLK